MKIFQCQACDQPVLFESTACESCERRLGYVCAAHAVSALEPTGPGIWHAYADPGRKYRLCANAEQGGCNWLVPADAPDAYCIACRHNRVVPDLSVGRNRERWRLIEAAKHRLFYSLIRLRLPLASRGESADGLAFDFLVDPAENQLAGPPVLTGHDNGLITLNIAEADAAERERRRLLFGEYYRTLLGHFRHEIGHYFWNVLVRHDPCLPAFRALFGDERADYGLALQRHYAGGPPSDWEDTHVSAYATAHPWEDFAETFAHYLHIVDTLETASAFEISVRPKPQRPAGSGAVGSGPVSGGGADDPAGGHVVIDFDPYEARELGALIGAWLPLTYAVNSLNRSMGQPALYPFHVTPAVIAKLAFVHARIEAARGERAAGSGTEVLKAVITGLRQRVATPMG